MAPPGPPGAAALARLASELLLQQQPPPAQVAAPKRGPFDLAELVRSRQAERAEAAAGVSGLREELHGKLLEVDNNLASERKWVLQ